MHRLVIALHRNCFVLVGIVNWSVMCILQYGNVYCCAVPLIMVPQYFNACYTIYGTQYRYGNSCQYRNQYRCRYWFRYWNQCQYGDRCRLGNSRRAGAGTRTGASTGICTETGTGTGVVTSTKLYYRVFPLQNIPRRFQIGKYCQYSNLTETD